MNKFYRNLDDHSYLFLRTAPTKDEKAKKSLQQNSFLREGDYGKAIQAGNGPNPTKARFHSKIRPYILKSTRQLKKTSNLNAIVPVTWKKGSIETKQQILELISSSESAEMEYIKQVQMSSTKDSSGIVFRFLVKKLVRESKNEWIPSQVHGSGT